jgi:hypothetical protein
MEILWVLYLTLCISSYILVKRGRAITHVDHISIPNMGINAEKLKNGYM